MMTEDGLGPGTQITVRLPEKILKQLKAVQQRDETRSDVLRRALFEWLNVTAKAR